MITPENVAEAEINGDDSDNNYRRFGVSMRLDLFAKLSTARWVEELSGGARFHDKNPVLLVRKMRCSLR